MVLPPLRNLGDLNVSNNKIRTQPPVVTELRAEGGP